MPGFGKRAAVQEIQPWRLNNAGTACVVQVDLTDHFGGTMFTWHALTTSGAPAQTRGQQGSPGGYSYQSSTPGY
jgi:hypothetical protein